MNLRINTSNLHQSSRDFAIQSPFQSSFVCNADDWLMCVFLCHSPEGKARPLPCRMDWSWRPRPLWSDPHDCWDKPDSFKQKHINTHSPKSRGCGKTVSKFGDRTTPPFNTKQFIQKTPEVSLSLSHMKNKHTQEGNCRFQRKFPSNSPLYCQCVPFSLSEFTTGVVKIDLHSFPFIRMGDRKRKCKFRCVTQSICDFGCNQSLALFLTESAVLNEMFEWMNQWLAY